MMKELKEKVYRANLDLVKHGLVLFTWGNVSEIDRKAGLIAIKPSGVSYEEMKPEDIVIVDMDGKIVEGKLRPSSDTPTHIELYKAFPGIGGVVHTHSTYATAYSQAGKLIPCYGTTHADYFYGGIICTRALTKEEIEKEYEKNTGLVIAEAFKDRDYSACPAVLVKSHAPFTWGHDGDNAVYNAVVLEQVAKMALFSESINKNIEPADQFLQDKHYYRKHGANAYYGQTKK